MGGVKSVLRIFSKRSIPDKFVMSEETACPDEDQLDYAPPPQKTISEIMSADQDDDALKRYKATLLGDASSKAVVIDASNKKNVLVRKLALVVDEGPTFELDLTGDISELKKKTFIIKEGIAYRIRIDFQVQREIVQGLKYVQKTSRLGIQVDKMVQMVGSYAPREDMQSFMTPKEDAPEGMAQRGTYTVKSLFTDDDGNEYLKWEWTFEIKKKWEKENE